MLSVKGLCKSYPSLPIFDRLNISFTQKRTCIVGANGSGKSTLLCILAGLVGYEQGSVCYLNKHTNKNPNLKLDLREYSALASDSITFPEFISANDVLTLTQQIWKCDWPTSFINAFNFSPHINKRVEALSAGNLKKLQLINAFMRYPQILLLDEPNIALDEPSVSALWKLIDEFEGMIIVASNEPELFTKRKFTLFSLPNGLSEKNAL